METEFAIATSSPMRRQMSAATEGSYKQIMSRHLGGVVVISCEDDNNEFQSFTATSMVSVSAEPPMVSFSLNKRAGCHLAFFKAIYTGISILDADQIGYARLFSTQSEERQKQEWYKTTARNCPILRDARNAILSRIVNKYNCGSSTLFVARVESVLVGESKSPLGYCNRSYVVPEPV